MIVSTAFYAFIASVLLAIGAVRSSRLMVHAFDSGIYLQILSGLAADWGSRNWSSLFLWPSSVTGESNFLGHHFQPIVIVLLPAYYFLKSPIGLFAVSALCIAMAVGLTALHSESLHRSLNQQPGSRRPLEIILGSLLFAVFPAFSARLYFGFAPDVLAVPALTMQAIFLSGFSARNNGVLFRPSRFGKISLGFTGALLFISSQIWSGACKEVFWIINSWVALLLAIQLRRHGDIRGSNLLVFWTVIQFAAFFWLFLVWMPGQSNHVRYYGLNYFDFKMTALLQTNWLAILELLFASGFFVALLRPSFCLLGAIPGLMIVILARYQQVQSTTAIYALAFVPFFIVAVSDNLVRLSDRRARIGRWLLWGAVVASIVLQLPLMYRSVRPAWTTSLENLPVDVADARQRFDKDAYLLVDGNLQPAFHRWRQVRIILGFVGNPAPLKQRDFDAATDVLTMLDVDQLNDCREIQPDSTDDWAAPGVPYYDYPGFVRFCQWLRNVSRDKVIYPNSGLVHYHLN